jgi:Tfp pilus assembly protein PilF
VLAIIAKHSGVIVKISGFDEFMLELVKQVLPEFKLEQLVQDIDRLAKERREKYREAARKNPDGWWDVELAVQAETDLDKREAMYREGLEKFPQSAELAGNFALFLANQRHDYDKAEHYYRKALELDLNNAINTGNFASFLATRRHDYAEAERYFRKALALEPNHANNLANFAHLRLLRRQGDDLAQLPAMLAQVITLAKGQASQTLAEALFYGVLSQALGQHSPAPYLARLKRVLALGYPRDDWDFTPLFDSVLPDIDPAQAQHYRALGEAILDDAALPALGALPWWQAVPEADPFTLPEEDQQSN